MQGGSGNAPRTRVPTPTLKVDGTLLEGGENYLPLGNRPLFIRSSRGARQKLRDIPCLGDGAWKVGAKQGTLQG